MDIAKGERTEPV